MADRTIRYLPQDLFSELERRVLTAETRAAVADPDFAWNVERLVEAAYARGYDEGYGRGMSTELARRYADERLALQQREAASADGEQ